VALEKVAGSSLVGHPPIAVCSDIGPLLLAISGVGRAGRSEASRAMLEGKLRGVVQFH
jgi:hypothetical protein